MNAVLEDKLNSLPSSPGIYQFLNEKGKVIYVGKAKNLRNRVRSYFKSKVDSPKTEVPTTPVETTPPAPVSTPTEPVVTPETPKVEEPLNDVLGKLETNMADTAPTNGVPVDQTPPVPPTPLTDEVSSTGVASAPSVPDFPGK